MKKLLLIFFLAAAFYPGMSQKSAADGDFEFVTQRNDGNSKIIKYTAINLSYNQYNHTVDAKNENVTYQNTGFTFSVEGYNTFGRKVAGSTRFGFAYFNGNYKLDLDYGLYFILFKGFYIKPYIGYGVLYDYSTELSPYVLNYGGDVGYQFKMNTPEGKRPLYLGVFAAYNAYSGYQDDPGSNYSNSYNGSGFAAGIKLMWGPKSTNE
jgi:hypothetical protein